MNTAAKFTEAMQNISKSNGNSGNNGNKPTPATVCAVPVTINRSGNNGNNGNKNTPPVPVVPVAKLAGTGNGNAANPHGSKLVPVVPAVPVENDLSLYCCPLHHLNQHGFYVVPAPTKGLVLHCDFAVSESLEGHIILWAMGQWDALLEAIGWTGAALPRRVVVKSRNLYHLPRRAA